MTQIRSSVRHAIRAYDQTFGLSKCNPTGYDQVVIDLVFQTGKPLSGYEEDVEDCISKEVTIYDNSARVRTLAFAASR